MEKTTSEFVSGYEFHKLAHHSFCPRYPINLNPQSIKENDLIFVNLDSLSDFLNIFSSNPPKNKFRLITHNSDGSFNHQHLDRLLPYVSEIYPINCALKGSAIIKKIPLGFVDNIYKPHHIFKKIRDKNDVKSIFVYMNFAINTNYTKRTECQQIFSNKTWVLSQSDIPAEDFYIQLSKSKYVLSPEGTGVDCHRIYESIFLDAIPIIKSCFLDDFYERLPILIVKNWEDATEDFLVENYSFYFERLKKWQYENPNWHSAKFWIT
jgi:hypothetical protein